MSEKIEMKTLTIDGVTFEVVDEVARSKGEGVFVGKYDTVTFADIKAAQDAGKVCFLNFSGTSLPLLGTNDTEAIFVREINETTDYMVTITSDGGKDVTLVDKNTPIYVAQTLTDDQKAQARTNIGALSAGDVDTVLQQAKDSGQFDGKDGEDGYTPVKGKDYFDGYTPVKGKDYFDGTNGKTAYAYAQDGGYTGTEAEFATKLASESDSVFVADYDTTTYAEVKAAHNAGKLCFVKSDGMPFCQLLGIDDSEAIFIREINETTDYKVTFTSAGGKDFTLVEKNTPIYVAQSLSDAQKAQARTNIGAAAAADLSKYVTTDTAQTITGVKTFNAPANVAGTEQHTVKFKTSNGGAIIFGKEAANSGTMLRFDQVDGTTRLRFRGSDSAGAIVWEQPEQGAQLYVDLGKQGVDKHRINFPSSGGTLALTSQIPSLSGYLPLSGGLMTGSLKFQAASLPGKSLQYICGVDAFASGGEMGWQSKADFLSGYATTGGNVNTSTMPLGFAGRVTGATWGNTIGTSFTSWNDPTGGSIDFRQDNPSSGKMSIKVDGRVYVNEGLNPVMGTELANSFWGMTSPDGENNVWIRTTTQGIIPYQSGGAGAGHCSLGTSSWYFANAYIDKVYGSNFSGLAAKATADANGNNIASTYANKNAGNTFNGEQKMVNSSYAPTMNDIASGVGCSLKNARACDNQLIVAEIFAPTTAATDSTINMNAVVGEIGFYHGGSGSGGQFSGKTQLARITSAGIYEGSTLLSNKYLAKSGGTMAGPLWITGGDSATAGKLVLNNNGSGQITDSGTSTLFGFVSTGNLTVGHSSYNLVMRGKVSRPTYNGANVALVSDVVEAANGSLKVTLSGTSVDKTLAQIETALNAGRHVYMAENDGPVYQLSMHMAGMMACFTSVVATSNTQVAVNTVVVYDGIAPSVFTKTL